MSEEVGILKTTGLLSIIVVITKVLQIAFLPVVASIFGTSSEFAGFIVAFSITSLFGGLVYGCFNTIFVPVFAEYKIREGEAPAWEFAGAFISVVTVIFIVLVFLGIVFSSGLVSLMVYGASAEFKELGAGLTQLLFLASVFTLLLSICTAVHYSYKSFIVPSVAVLSGAAVLLITVIAVKGGIGIYVLPLALMLSGLVSFLSAAFSMPRMKRIGIRLSAAFTHHSIRRVGLMMFLISLSGILGQFGMMINRFFASYLDEGSIAVLEYAYRFVSTVCEFIAATLVVPLFQKMSSESVLDEYDKVQNTFFLGIKMTSVVLIPLTFFAVLLRMPVFNVLLEYGRFTVRDTEEVASVFLYLSPAMLGIGFSQIIGNAFLALRKANHALVISFCFVLLNGLLDVVLFRSMGVRGLALATGLASCIITVSAFLVFVRLTGALRRDRLSGFLSKTVISAVLSSAAGWLVFYRLMSAVDTAQTVKLCVSAAVSVVVYAALMSAFKVSEINFVIDIIRGKIKASLK